MARLPMPMTDEMRELCREWLHSQVDRALDSATEADVVVRAGVRVYPPLKHQQAVRRKQTGKRSLILHWKEPVS